jgi:hypothetical protein
MSILTRVLLLALVFITPGCDLFGSPSGEFVGVIRGDEEATLQWEGVLYDNQNLSFHGPPSRSHPFGSQLFVGPGDFALGVPYEPGRYPLAAYLSRPRTTPFDTLEAGVIIRTPDEAERTYFARSGELVLETVTPEGATGTLRFVGVERDDSTRTVEVEGRFTAPYLPYRR